MADVPLGEVIHFDALTFNSTTGAAADADSAPTFCVYEEATDTALTNCDTVIMTKRTSLTGNYRGTFTASTANGFEVGKWYIVIAIAIVGGITGKAIVQSFRMSAAEVIVGTPKVDVDGSVGFSVMGTGTVTAGATTTSIPTSACSPAGAIANQFMGRSIIFTAATTTTTLRGLACSVTASSNAATPTFTVAMSDNSALPAAPVSGDTFVIV